MKILASKSVMFSGLLVLAQGGIVSSDTQLEKISSLSSAITSLDSKLLPIQIKPEIDKEQTFVLHSKGAADLAFIPVSFIAPANVEPAIQCGFYLMSPNSTQKYVNAIGLDEVDVCDKLDALGMMTEPGSRPRMIFIYEASSPHDDHYVLPLIFSWDASRSTYVLNKEQSQWVLHQKPYTYTVTRVRQLLAKQYPAQNKGESNGKPIQ